MVTKRDPRRGPRVPYKVTVALFQFEWDEIAMEAKARNVSGGELIAALLSQYVKGRPRTEEPPIPAAAPEDA